MALLLDMICGEKIDIDLGRIVITIERKNGQRTRLRVEAHRSIPIKKVSTEGEVIPIGRNVM